MQPSLHDELFTHQLFLDRLARRLVADDGSAQDLVQETWIRALTHPPREKGAVRTWLTTVVRRLAGREQRSRDRRVEHEQAAARSEAGEDPIEAVDRRLDAQALLLERLRRLPEAQRIALTLRYADDLDPQAIAERLGVSVNTVKARLRRGLVALREDLDRATGGDRTAWVLALLPGTPTDLALATSATSGGLLWTGILMTTATKAALAVAAVAAALVLWVRWSPDSVPAPSDSIEPSSEIAAETARLQTDPALQPAGDGTGRAEAIGAGGEALHATQGASPPAGSITGHVLIEEGDESTRQVALFGFDEHGSIEEEPLDVRPCTSDGGFRLQSARSGKHALCALARLEAGSDQSLLRPATRLVEIVVGENVELEPIVLDTSEEVRGRVVWADGKAVFPGRVHVSSGFRGVPTGPWPRACKIGDSTVQWRGERFEKSLFDFVDLQQDGVFRLVGLEPRQVTITGHRSIQAGEGLVPNYQNRDPNPRARAEVVPPSEGIELVIDVPPVRFRVLANGAPLHCWCTYRIDKGGGTMQTSKDGFYDLLVKPELRVDIEFSHEDYLSKRLVFEPFELAAGSTIDVHMEPGPPTASLVLNLPTEVGARLGERGIGVDLYALDDPAGVEQASHAGGGSYIGERAGLARIHPSSGFRKVERNGNEFAVHGLKPGRYLVVAFPTGDFVDAGRPPWLDASFEIELASGERARRQLEPELGGQLRVEVNGALASGRAEFVLEDEQGQVVTVSYAQYDPVNVSRSGSGEPRPGLNHALSPLPPGAYQLHVRRRGETLLTLPVEIRADETTDVAVDLSRL